MNTEPADRTAKFKKIKRLLLDEHVLVHLKPSYPGVDIPPHLRSAPTVTLKLSTLFRGGLEVQEDSIVAELLFNAEYYQCHIPLDAIGAVTDVSGETFFWEEPSTEATPVPSPKKKTAVRKAPQPSAGERPVLRRVK